MIRRPVTGHWPWATAAVLLFAALLFTLRLGARSLWSEEVRWAQIPREMEQSGRWFWPTFNGRAYYDKPLASYWLVLLARRIPGVSAETAARLPCALAGLLAVWLVTAIARRLYGNAAAPLAGLTLATSFGFVFFARNASADMETVAGMLAALWLFLRNEHRPGGWWTVLFWITMALTSLTKGLLGFALPILVIGVYGAGRAGSVSDRCNFILRILRAQTWFVHRKTLIAVPLAVLVYLAPFAISYWQTGCQDGLAMVFRENLRRFVDPVNHRGPIYLYVPVLFELAAPWCLLLPAALWHAHARGGQRFALCFFWTIFAFFTLSASRRSYYLLPILPAVALLVAPLLLQAPAMLTTTTRRLLLGMSPRRVAWMCSIVAVVGMTAIFLIALPELESWRTRRPFAAEVQERIANAGRLALYDEREVVYYLTGPIREFDKPEALDDAIRAGEVKWVLTRQADAGMFAARLRPVLWEPEQPWEQESQRKSKLVLLKAEQ